MGNDITDYELRVLSHIWDLGGRAQVNEILDEWTLGDGEERKPGYTTVLKTLQKLEAKGIVSHESGPGRAYIYVALITRHDGSRDRLRQLVQTVFGGDRLAFAHAFLDEAELTETELAELKGMLERYQDGTDHA
ncbi:MAG: BlaI/MecI/CopY family transcriptional regulator [Spirochaetota bacterium]